MLAATLKTIPMKNRPACDGRAARDFFIHPAGGRDNHRAYNANIN
jgi:hypothetical protein